MRIRLLVESGVARKCRTPFDGADHAVAEGACPHCGVEPFKIAGSGRRIAKDDRAYEADGGCLNCNRYVGIIRAETNTLFGVREDEAVARYVTIGGGRVY